MIVNSTTCKVTCWKLVHTIKMLVFRHLSHVFESLQKTKWHYLIYIFIIFCMDYIVSYMQISFYAQIIYFLVYIFMTLSCLFIYYFLYQLCLVSLLNSWWQGSFSMIYNVKVFILVLRVYTSTKGIKVKRYSNGMLSRAKNANMT